jgi:hypothetical protein
MCDSHQVLCAERNRFAPGVRQFGERLHGALLLIFEIVILKFKKYDFFSYMQIVMTSTCLKKPV